MGDTQLEHLSNLEGYYLNELYRRMTEGYVILGQFKQAVEYARKALSFCDKFYLESFESNHGWVEYHLARALYFAGEYEEAEHVIRDAIRAFEEIGDQWSVNYSYDILGQILLKQGQCEAALVLNKRSYETLILHYGKEHADVARNMEYRGNIYRAMGDEEKAAGCFRQAVEIYRKCNCHKRAEAVAINTIA